jgi:hypothetical protein
MSDFDVNAFFSEQDHRMNLSDDDFDEYLIRMATSRKRFVHTHRSKHEALGPENFGCSQNAATFTPSFPLLTSKYLIDEQEKPKNTKHQSATDSRPFGLSDATDGIAEVESSSISTPRWHPLGFSTCIETNTHACNVASNANNLRLSLSQ